MLSRLRVLLVEDHAFQRRLGGRMLEDVGLRDHLEAADGEAALEVLQAQAEPVDVALVDLDLPGMDGVELIRAIADRRLARAVALVSAIDVSVQHTIALMTRAAGLRMLGCIEKPLTRERLSEVLKIYLDGEPTSPELLEEVLSVDVIGRALGDGEVMPWFQPQVEMRNGRVVGVEALARWRRADGSVLPASRFIAQLERTRHSAALAELTLAEAARAWARWKARGLDLKVSVNLCAADLDEPQIADRYEGLVREAGMPTDRLVFEVTESSVLGDTVRGLGILARLRLKGFGLSIDDFGTGYSSLSQLSQLPFTELKIDRSFVSGVERMPKNKAMIAATIDLARRLDLEVVAEGVERTEEWQILAELGCHAAQGWLVSPAVPSDDLPPAVERWQTARG
jgi:EAL domain-containing protein (putative c-di-GMP-specific phosphodiesterase class I)/AmiR/NasT family two-component response regulator